MLVLAIVGAALLAGAAFVCGAWFGYAAARRAVCVRVRALAALALARLWGSECASEPFLSELEGKMLELLDSIDEEREPRGLGPWGGR